MPRGRISDGFAESAVSGHHRYIHILVPSYTCTLVSLYTLTPEVGSYKRKQESKKTTNTLSTKKAIKKKRKKKERKHALLAKKVRFKKNKKERNGKRKLELNIKPHFKMYFIWSNRQMTEIIILVLIVFFS